MNKVVMLLLFIFNQIIVVTAMEGIEEKIENAVSSISKNFQYDKDNLLCWTVSGQPHFLVWSSSLAIHPEIGPLAKKQALENAQEEMFGVKDEGSHAVLCHTFFQQLGNFERKHYEKTKAGIIDVYKSINNHKATLTFVTCIEMASITLMPKIGESMKEYGATDFYYIDIHKMADNSTDGHSMQFIQALEAENPTLEELDKEITLFKNLCSKIFEQQKL